MSFNISFLKAVHALYYDFPLLFAAVFRHFIDVMYFYLFIIIQNLGYIYTERQGINMVDR